MAEYPVLVTVGDEEFLLAHITVQEMAKVQSWTGYKNRDQWKAEIGQEDPNALIAAYVLAKHRKGVEVRFSDVDFDLDEVAAKWVDESGREVEPLWEQDADGTPTLTDGVPRQVLDATGSGTWVYSDSKTPVPPTRTASEPTSDTPPTPINSLVSVSGTQAI